VCSSKLCDLCNEIGESVSASVVCKDEQLYLCHPCGRKHQVQRATKAHKVINIEVERNEEVLCELCLIENEKVKAYGYCETCEESEYMCISCSKRHTTSKIFKGHLVNINLENKPKNSTDGKQRSVFLYKCEE
jgi:transposase-like protein